MNRADALKWCVDNLDEWPKKLKVMDIEGWMFWRGVKDGVITFSDAENRISESDWILAKQKPSSDSESVFADDKTASQINLEKAVERAWKPPGVDIIDGMIATPGLKPRSKYHREIKPGVWVDVYDVLNAFDPDNRNAADDHAIKKMLLPGKRGVKDAKQDRQEAIKSLTRSLEILG